MSRPVRSFLRPALLAAVVALILPRPSPGQVIVKVTDTTFFRLGLQLQAWADETQDPVSGGYSQNFFLRRIRFMVGGQVAPDVTFFLETESPRPGNAALIIQDVLAEWRIAADRVILVAGLLIPPTSRNILTGSGGLLSLDNAAFALQANALTQSSAARDIGLQAKGYLAGDHLEYRVGAFDGQRQPTTADRVGSRNPFRFAARLQYDVFDPEKGYVYTGTSLGAKRILAVGAWGETQGDYRAGGADVALDWPVARHDAASAEMQYVLYDGGKQFTQTIGRVAVPLLPRQTAFFGEGGYYFHSARLQPFLRYERLDFDDAAFASREQARGGGGFNWYIAGQNMKVSAFYERIVPRVRPAGAAQKNTNHFALQLQLLYF